MSHGAVRIAGHRLRALRWRTLSTSTDALPNLPPPLPRHKPRSPHPRMIFVRPWDGIPTMAHAFAIVRAIERRFGRIQDFVLVRDPDVLSIYCPYLHATFARAEDAEAIPLDGKIIQVEEPPVDKNGDGGIGLDDLHVYLNPETREKALLDREYATEQEPEVGPPEGRIMDVKLERTEMRDPPLVLDRVFGLGRRGPPHLNNSMRTQELAHAIHAFGGFVNQPADAKDQTGMQKVVARWTRMIARQPPRRFPEQPREEVADETHIENSEEPVAPNKEPSWIPFGTETVIPSSLSASLTSPTVAPTHVPPPVASSPVVPPSVVPPSAAPLPVKPSPAAPSAAPSASPSSRRKPTSEANFEQHLRKPEPQSAPKTTPVEPKLSKKQRMLNAARLAGAMAAENPPDPSEQPVTAHSGTSTPMVDVDAEQSNTSLGQDPKASEEDNKVAARKWWYFLTGGKSD